MNLCASSMIALLKEKRQAVIPGLAEQQDVLEVMAARTVHIDNLLAEGEKAINILKERRSALISAAVIGKVDVRNWQPPADESVFDEDVQQAGLEAMS